MRLRLSLVFLVLATLPQVAAGPIGTLDSDSPVDLFGAAFAGGDDLVLFHKGFAAGTLSGTLYSGNIVDRERRYDSCFPGSPPRETTRTLGTASSSTPDPIYFEMDARGLAIVEFGDELRAPAGSGDATAADEAGAEPAAFVGPNPYPIQATDSGAGTDATAQGSVQAFPTGEFLVVPMDDLELPFTGTVVVPYGNLTLVQGGKATTFNSDPTSAPSSCAPPTPFTPPFSDPVFHTFRIQADTANLKLRQQGVERILAFYDADAAAPTPTPNDYERVCPQSEAGYWSGNDGTLQRFYESCSLPATSFTSNSLQAQVDGIARFGKATGTVARAADDETLKDETVDLAGNLELTPAAVEESGKRMRTELAGSVFTVDSPDVPSAAGQDWQPYAAGAAGGALLLGVLLYSWPMLKWRFALLGAPLYARLKKDEVLENPLRDDILAHVQETPGISASELGRRVECGWGTLVYHLTVLERMHLVSSAREGRHKRFFAQGRINYSDKGAVGLLANPAARTILDAIRTAPGSIQKDLSERLNLSPGTVAWHVERLAAEGLVIKEDEGRTVRYYPSERLLQLTQRLAA
jgi:predicted transcriptional regulator